MIQYALYRPYRWLESRLRRYVPWTRTYGLARTLLALATLLTLIANPPSVLFHGSEAHPAGPVCNGLGQASLFCLFPEDLLWLSVLVAAAILVVVALGWRPSVTGPLHWYATWSVAVSIQILEGGDQLAAILALILLPVCLTDPRRSHWDAPELRNVDDAELLKRFVAVSALVVAAIQVWVVYLQAAVSKFGVAEWADGTAMYYWLLDPSLGAPSWGVLREVLLTPGGVLAFTWGSLAVELFLVIAVLARRPVRRLAFFIGVIFHVLIAVFMGLVTFGIVMSAALILYLRPQRDDAVPFSGHSEQNGVVERAKRQLAADASV